MTRPCAKDEGDRALARGDFKESLGIFIREQDNAARDKRIEEDSASGRLDARFAEAEAKTDRPTRHSHPPLSPSASSQRKKDRQIL